MSSWTIMGVPRMMVVYTLHTPFKIPSTTFRWPSRCWSWAVRTTATTTPSTIPMTRAAMVSCSVTPMPLRYSFQRSPSRKARWKPTLNQSRNSISRVPIGSLLSLPQPLGRTARKAAPGTQPGSRRLNAHPYFVVIYLSTIVWKVPSAFSSAIALFTASSRAVLPFFMPMA